MRRSLCPLSVVFMALIQPSVRAGEIPDHYLTDGKLKERIDVLELQGGVVGFTGVYYAIEADGSWSTGPVRPRQEEKGVPTAKGKLNKEQLVQLAKELARYDLAHLPSHGEPAVNPKVIRIVFGKKVSELQPGRGKAPAEEDKEIRGRYDGILRAIETLCTGSKQE